MNVSSGHRAYVETNGAQGSCHQDDSPAWHLQGYGLRGESSVHWLSRGMTLTLAC
jgi:hypothetical protein